MQLPMRRYCGGQAAAAAAAAAAEFRTERKMSKEMFAAAEGGINVTVKKLLKTVDLNAVDAVSIFVV